MLTCRLDSQRSETSYYELKRPPSSDEKVSTTFGDLGVARPGLMRQPTSPGILLVDDEAGVRRVLELGLTQSGFKVWQAESGGEAVELYRSHTDKIDLVLLDVRMPSMNGPETLAALKAVNSAVKVCYLTGEPGAFTEDDLLASGAVGVLYKPFTLTALADRLRQLLAEC